jgi:hypothetical protein
MRPTHNLQLCEAKPDELSRRERHQLRDIYLGSMGFHPAEVHSLEGVRNRKAHLGYLKVVAARNGRDGVIHGGALVILQDPPQTWKLGAAVYRLFNRGTDCVCCKGYRILALFGCLVVAVLWR